MFFYHWSVPIQVLNGALMFPEDEVPLDFVWNLFLESDHTSQQILCVCNFIICHEMAVSPHPQKPHLSGQTSFLKGTSPDNTFRGR